MQPRVLCENDKISVWHRVSTVYLYPLCGSEILVFYWLPKSSKLSNVVLDPLLFEAYVCLSRLHSLKFWHFLVGLK